MFHARFKALALLGLLLTTAIPECCAMNAAGEALGEDPHSDFPSTGEIHAMTQKVHGGFRERADALLERAVIEVMPSFPEGAFWKPVAAVQKELLLATGGEVKGAYRREPPGLGAANQALGVLWLPQFEEHRPLANQMIVAMGKHWLADPHDLTEPPVYWSLGPLVRLYFLFHAGSSYLPGRLTEEAEERIRELLWNFCAGRSGLEKSASGKLLRVYDSENHDIMHKTTYYLAAIIFASHPEYAGRTYYDGSTPAEQKEAWAAYFREWLRLKATGGLWIERNSSTYAQFSLSGLLNLFDFTDAPDLRQRARMLLDLSLVDWAQEQIHGVRGGAASRTSPAGIGRDHPMWGLGWVLFGNVGGLAYDPPQQIFGVTTAYRPPATAVALTAFPPQAAFEIANRAPGEGSSPHFDLVALARERFGRAADPQHPRRNIPIYSLRADSRLLNYSYRTPEYVLGMAMIDPNLEYTLIHAQAKWAGAVIPGEDGPVAKIGPAPLGPGGTPLHFHAYWGVQDKNAMILQKPGIASRIDKMRIFFSPHLEITEEEGWTFAELNGAYAAVRVVTGGYTWADEASSQLVLRDPGSPVILQMGRKLKFGTFEEFRKAVREAPLLFEDGRLDYAGPGAAPLTFFAEPDPDGRYQLPQIDGHEVCLDPEETYQSPFLRSYDGSERIEIRTGPLSFHYDFRAGEVREIDRGYIR